MNSIRYFSYFWQRVFRINASFLLFMSIMRLILLMRTPLSFSILTPMPEILNCFIIGLRFDLLVICFLLIPLLLATYVLALGLWNILFLWATRIYLFLVWTLVCVISLIDGAQFTKSQQRLRHGGYEHLWSINWPHKVFHSFQENPLVCFLFAVVFVLGFTSLWTQKISNWKSSAEKMSRLNILIKILIPLIVVLLGARGSLGPHHLDYRDSQFSTFSPINELSLNALWTFDKQ